MAAPARRVQPGEPLAIPAAVWNDLVAMLRERGREGTLRPGPAPGGRGGGLVLVRNSSGQDVGWFGILGVDGVVYTPEDNEAGFLGQPVLDGKKPTEDHRGRFVVVLEPIAAGAVGRAIAQGLTPVRVQVAEGEEDLEFADVCTDEGEECLYLVMAGQGAAQVLWLDAATDPPADPDVRWALVRLANAMGAAPAIAVHGLRVTGVWKAYGESWGGFETDGYITFVTGQFAFLDKSWVDEESDDLYINATGPRGKNAPIGYRDIAPGDFIGWVEGDYFEEVPGASGGHYHGVVVPFVGPEGALPSWEVTAGKGLVLDDPVPYDRKLHVELEATKPGLKFHEETDDGRLMVKPNEDRGITVTASGVEAKIDDGAKGLRFSAGGNIEVEPNPAKAIEVIAAGVGVVADTQHGISVSTSGVAVDIVADHGLDFSDGDLLVEVNNAAAIGVDADGVKWLYDTAKGLDVSGDKAVVKVYADHGLTVDANGLYVKIEPNGPLTVGASGLDLGVADFGGLTYDDTGNLKADVEGDADGWIMLDLAGKVAHKKLENTIRGFMVYEDGDGKPRMKIKVGGSWVGPQDAGWVEWDDAGHVIHAELD